MELKRNKCGTETIPKKNCFWFETFGDLFESRRKVCGEQEQAGAANLFSSVTASNLCIQRRTGPLFPLHQNCVGGRSIWVKAEAHIPSARWNVAAAQAMEAPQWRGLDAQGEVTEPRPWQTLQGPLHIQHHGGQICLPRWRRTGGIRS